LSGLGDLPLASSVITNGVEFDRFATGDESDRQGAVYVGSLDHRFQWLDLICLARAYPDVPFRIFGPLSRDTPQVPANVELRGALPYDRIHLELGRAQIGLLPLSDRPENAGRSPMKLYEYLAAGLHVVATGTPVTRSLADVVVTYDSPDSAVEKFGRLLQLPVNLAGRSAARAQDWSRKADALVQFVSGLTR
jgi:teichuronic acid biosynthesis glycosyltransferase TuaH